MKHTKSYSEASPLHKADVLYIVNWFTELLTTDPYWEQKPVKAEKNSAKAAIDSLKKAADSADDSVGVFAYCIPTPPKNNATRKTDDRSFAKAAKGFNSWVEKSPAARTDWSCKQSARRFPKMFYGRKDKRGRQFKRESVPIWLESDAPAKGTTKPTDESVVAFGQQYALAFAVRTHEAIERLPKELAAISEKAITFPLDRHTVCFLRQSAVDVEAENFIAKALRGSNALDLTESPKIVVAKARYTLTPPDDGDVPLHCHDAVEQVRSILNEAHHWPRNACSNLVVTKELFEEIRHLFHAEQFAHAVQPQGTEGQQSAAIPLYRLASLRFNVDGVEKQVESAIIWLNTKWGESGRDQKYRGLCVRHSDPAQREFWNHVLSVWAKRTWPSHPVIPIDCHESRRGDLGHGTSRVLRSLWNLNFTKYEDIETAVKAAIEFHKNKNQVDNDTIEEAFSALEEFFLSAPQKQHLKHLKQALKITFNGLDPQPIIVIGNIDQLDALSSNVWFGSTLPRGEAKPTRLVLATSATSAAEIHDNSSLLDLDVETLRDNANVSIQPLSGLSADESLMLSIAAHYGWDFLETWLIAGFNNVAQGQEASNRDPTAAIQSLMRRGILAPSRKLVQLREVLTNSAFASETAFNRSASNNSALTPHDKTLLSNVLEDHLVQSVRPAKANVAFMGMDSNWIAGRVHRDRARIETLFIDGVNTAEKAWQLDAHEETYARCLKTMKLSELVRINATQLTVPRLKLAYLVADSSRRLDSHDGTDIGFDRRIESFTKVLELAKTNINNKNKDVREIAFNVLRALWAARIAGGQVEEASKILGLLIEAFPKNLPGKGSKDSNWKGDNSRLLEIWHCQAVTKFNAGDFKGSKEAGSAGTLLRVTSRASVDPKDAYQTYGRHYGCACCLLFEAIGSYALNAKDVDFDNAIDKAEKYASATISHGATSTLAFAYKSLGMLLAGRFDEAIKSAKEGEEKSAQKNFGETPKWRGLCQLMNACAEVGKDLASGKGTANAQQDEYFKSLNQTITKIKSDCKTDFREYSSIYEGYLAAAESISKGTVVTATFGGLRDDATKRGELAYIGELHLLEALAGIALCKGAVRNEKQKLRNQVSACLVAAEAEAIRQKQGPNELLLRRINQANKILQPTKKAKTAKKSVPNKAKKTASITARGTSRKRT